MFILMVRSFAKQSVSNHAGPGIASILRDAAAPLLRMRLNDPPPLHRFPSDRDLA
jgi:hypothetical protein